MTDIPDYIPESFEVQNMQSNEKNRWRIVAMAEQTAERIEMLSKELEVYKQAFEANSENENQAISYVALVATSLAGAGMEVNSFVKKIIELRDKNEH